MRAVIWAPWWLWLLAIPVLLGALIIRAVILAAAAIARITARAVRRARSSANTV
jgi:hypothetical protein